MPNMMEMMKAGVPVTLLLDVLGGHAPDSRRLYVSETVDTSWVRAA